MEPPPVPELDGPALLLGLAGLGLADAARGRVEAGLARKEPPESCKTFGLFFAQTMSIRF